jgi:paraquat-inducible protein B
VLIKQRYAKLVRSGSKFWNVSGLDVNFGLFRGLEINMESLKSVAAAGIAFATPYDLKDHPAKDGMAFQLYNKPAKEWLEWAPKVQLLTMKQSHEKDSKQNPARHSTRQIETTKVPEPRRIED